MVDQSHLQPRDGNQTLVRLICLPFAGGGSAPFYRWRRMLPAAIGLMPLTLPGHDGRLNEQPLTDLRTLVGMLVDDLLSSAAEQAFVLLGHSMGAWLAFEMSRELRRRRARMPELLVAAASRAPHLPLSDAPIHDLPEQEFLGELQRRYGGIAPELSASPELLRLVLPALRADIEMVETYEYTSEPPLDVEILALGGTDDTAVSPAQLDGWRQHTVQTCSVRLLPGGHFFVFGGERGIRADDEAAHVPEASPALRLIIARIEKCLATRAADGCMAQN